MQRMKSCRPLSISDAFVVLGAEATARAEGRISNSPALAKTAVGRKGMHAPLPAHERWLLRQIKAIRIHDLRPSAHEVGHELLVGVILGIDFGIGPEDRVRTESEIQLCRGPL